MSPNRQRGFTLIELLIVIMIIGILIGIAFPAFVAVRNSAQSTQCKSNLRQFAICLLNRSAQNPNGSFCTGAFDFRRDGAYDQFGWVADCAGQDVLAGQLLCPTSICVGSEKLLPGSSGSDGASGGVGATSTGSAFRSDRQPPSRAGTVFRDNATVGDVVGAGFNTNYATSWHLVRSQLVLNNNSIVGDPKQWWDNNNSTQVTLGPLTLQQLDSGDVPATAIPMIGCGTQGDVAAGAASGDGLLPGTIDPNLRLIQGAPVAESFNDGPSISDGAAAVRQIDAALPTNVSGATSNQFLAWQGQNYASVGEASIPNQVLQDTRDWFAYHNNSLNVVMADGSVQSFDDVNKDGFINPGFAVGTGATFETTGYTSSEIEVNPFQMFPGVLLNGSFRTKRFEQ